MATIIISLLLLLLIILALRSYEAYQQGEKQKV